MSSMVELTDKDAVIEAHLPLVKRIAYHLMSRLPASVEVDDLIQAGLIGLLDAVERFDDNQGAHFETYATLRIRGAMLDELRDSDWASRALRKASRRIEQAIHLLQQRLQRPPTEHEIAGQLGVPIHDYFELLNESRGAQLIYYEDIHPTDDDSFLEHFVDKLVAGPFEILSSQKFRKALTQAVVERRDAGVPVSVRSRLILSVAPVGLGFAIRGGVSAYAIALLLFLATGAMIDISRSVYETLVRALTLARDKQALAEAREECLVGQRARPGDAFAAHAEQRGGGERPAGQDQPDDERLAPQSRGQHRHHGSADDHPRRVRRHQQPGGRDRDGEVRTDGGQDAGDHELAGGQGEDDEHQGEDRHRVLRSGRIKD